ncbi:MAG: aminoglycoside phosphotransferase, partial [Gammaproteobacteria bacterium]
LALQSGVLKDVEERRFLRWFDWMGVQRHLKAAGIFARLNYRDGKHGFLQDIPRTVSYIGEVAGRYEELADLHELVETRVLPRLKQISESR